MVGQPKLTLPCTVRARTKNTGEGVVDRTAPSIWVALTKMAFWGILTAANVHPPMVVSILLQMFILSFHHDSTYVLLTYILILFLHNIPICNIDLMFGRVRIIYF